MERELTPDAFEAEALPHLNDLYRTTRRLLRDGGAAEDLLQEVYLQAWKSFHKYEPGTNCRAWLYKILFNKIDHHRRRQTTRRRFVADGEEFIAETLASPSPVPAGLTDAEVLRALDRLVPRFREAVLLADVEEFSYKEISEILGVPIGTVMSRLSRARAQLRTTLSGVARDYGIGVAAKGAEVAAAAC